MLSYLLKGFRQYVSEISLIGLGVVITLISAYFIWRPITEISDATEENTHYEPEEVLLIEELQTAPNETLLTIDTTPSHEGHRRTPFVPIRGSLRSYADDAAEVIAFVEAVHVNFIIEGRMCMETYEAFREEYLASTANAMNFTEFTLATQRFLSVFQDGHMSRTLLAGRWVWRNNDWEWQTNLVQNGDFIDHNFLFRNGGLFLADENLVITDIEVLAIGGVSVDEILAVVDRHYGAYNYTGTQRARGRYSRYQVILQLAGASLYMYGGNLVTDLTLLKDGMEYIMEIGFTSTHPSGYRAPDFEPEYRMRWEMIDDDIFYISLGASLTYAHTSYVEKAIAAIEQTLASGVRKIIVDLRNFPGGSVLYAQHLLNAMGISPLGKGLIMRLDDVHREWIDEYYPTEFHRQFQPTLGFTQEDFAGRDYIYIPRNPGQSINPYDVFIVALTSERSFSGAVAIASEIADSGFGIVIGEPSATSPSGYGWARETWLYNSHLQIRTAHVSVLRPDENADQLTLWPDIHVYEWYALEVALEFLAEM